MDKERLEEFEAIRNYYVDDMRFRYGRNPYSDIKLLISTVEEQQKEIEGRKDFESRRIQQVNNLIERNKIYKQALKFYADERNYEFETIVTDCDIEVDSKILADGGEKASQALEESE